MFDKAVVHSPSRVSKGLIGVVGAMAATASLVAAAAIRRRRLAQANSHPLKGSIQRRINLFAVLAERKRGVRAVEAAEDYHQAPEDTV